MALAIFAGMRTVPPTQAAAAASLLSLVLAAGCGQAPVSPPATAVMGAAPVQAPTRCELPRTDALQAINAARARPQRCGSRLMAAAPPLRWNEQLYWAADVHSRDMAGKDYFEHRDPAGNSVRERVRAQNYRWRHVGENIAGGTDTLERTVATWLASPPHCENLMEPDYQEAALACAERAGTEYENYWTLVMGRR